ncbi:MAG: hypothetical protein ACRDTC_21700 [Pseudonocardiaceae bacterium]
MPLDEYRGGGHHIIASSGFDQPSAYAEVFRTLGKEGVFDADFAVSVESAAEYLDEVERAG